MLLWFFIWAFSSGMVHKQDGLTLTMLDVKQGAAFVLRTPNGRTILYDCGTFGSRDVGEQVVAPFLWNKGITKIDTLILSHAHLDHINGLPGIMERFRVKTLLISPHFNRTFWGKRMLGLLNRYKISLTEISSYMKIDMDGDLSFEILGPPNQRISDNENDLSLVLKIRYGNKSILLTGDIQAEGLKALLDSNKDLSADILQIPHHGFALKPDKTGRNYLEELIAKVTPSEIVINTDGGEIDEGILDICQPKDIIIHTSDKDGAVELNLPACPVGRDADRR
jgi:competence protein ComEC